MTEFKLEFSEDDLSIANDSCSRVDITDLVEKGSLKWSGGIDRLGEPPRDGQLSFTLRGREFEPLNPDSTYYPNVKRGRRFFLSFLRGASWQQEYVGYARAFRPTWPGNVTFQTVEVTCGDGFDVLARERLPVQDPPTAQSYSDVVLSRTGLFSYWKHDESVDSEGRSIEDSGPNSIAAFATNGFASPGQAGVVPVDASTSMRYTNNNGAFRPAAGDDGTTDPLNFQGKTGLTVEAWVRVVAYGSGTANVVKGPLAITTDSSGEQYRLGFSAATQKALVAVVTEPTGDVDLSISSTTSLVVGDAYHIVLAYGAGLLRLYLNGVLEAMRFANPQLATPEAGEYAVLGALGNASGNIADVGHVAIYDRMLEFSEILANYRAGALRGYPRQTAGERVAALTDLSLWDASGITASSFDVLPVTHFGQSRLDEIDRARRAEGARTLVFFDRDGNPNYHGWEWQSAAPYDEPQAVFGAPPQGSELAFDSENFRFDDEVYSEATKARVGGGEHTVSVSVPENERAAAEPETEIILTNDADVARVCSEFLDIYSDARYTLEELTVHGADEDALEVILDSHIGTRIRYRRRVTEDDGTTLTLAHDIVTHIIGFDAYLDAGDNIVMTWKLARGIDMTAGLWRLGLVGASELDTTTTLA